MVEMFCILQLHTFFFVFCLAVELFSTVSTLGALNELMVRHWWALDRNVPSTVQKGSMLIDLHYKWSSCSFGSLINDLDICFMQAISSIDAFSQSAARAWTQPLNTTTHMDYTWGRFTEGLIKRKSVFRNRTEQRECWRPINRPATPHIQEEGSNKPAALWLKINC